MKISTKGRYAIRMMLDMALNNTGNPMRIKDIALRQDISEKYLEQIASILTKAGLIKSVRGPQGGYHLTSSPEKYTIGMILRVTEGSLSPVACLEDEVNQCQRQDNCVTLMLWKKLDDAILSIVDTTTLANLVEWHYNQIDHYVI